MDKKKYKKTHTQPRIVGYVNDKKVSKPTDKKRIAAYFLLGFMVFWTICSCLTVYLFFDREKDSAMITADAAEVVEPEATNNETIEISLIGLVSSDFYYVNYNGTDEFVNGLFHYLPSIVFNSGSSAIFRVYEYDRIGSIPFDEYLNGPTSTDYRFSSTATYFELEVFNNDARFVAQWLSGSSYPTPDLIPLQVNYVSSSHSFNDAGSYSGYDITFVFRNESGAIYTYNMFFGVYGRNFTSGLANFSDSFFTVPMAPLTYLQYRMYNLNVETIDKLRDENLALYERIASLEIDIDRAYHNGVSDGYYVGLDDGYYDGFNDGVADSNDYSFIGLISAVIDVPVKAFIGLFNFDVLGFNMANFFLSLLSLAFIIKIVSLFF